MNGTTPMVSRGGRGPCDLKIPPRNMDRLPNKPDAGAAGHRLKKGTR